jgi:hypothetical protein
MGELTQPEIVRLEGVPDVHRVVGDGEESPLVERPDSRVVCVQPRGRVATVALVSRVQSYLGIDRC